MKVRDKVAVITGGAGGIGAALGERFLAEGVKTVVLADRDEVELKKISSAMGATGIGCDVRQESALHDLIEQTEAQFRVTLHYKL